MIEPTIQRMLQQATGLDLSISAVEVAIGKRMKQRHIGDRSSYVSEAIGNPDEFGALIDLVVVPETWFFRDPEAFAVAARFALKLQVSARRPARILSVPCAAGEEPYSLAMALLSSGVARNSFLIDAVDVSPQAIRRAHAGVYSRGAFRSRDLQFRNRYFAPCGGGFELAPEIRRLVHFRCGNLLTLEPLDGNQYDIIFCRNLLIYFNEATQAAAIRKLEGMLDDDGLLFCGYAETTTFSLHNFTRAPYANAFAVQKRRNAEHNESDAHSAFLPRIVSTSTDPRKTPRMPRPVTAPMPAASRSEASANNAEGMLEHANRMADQGAADEASRAYRDYLEVVPDSAQAHFMLGLLSEQRGDDRSAVEFLRRAVYLDPNHYEALCHLSLLADRHGNKTGAQNYRQRAGRVFERRTVEHKP